MEITMNDKKNFSLLHLTDLHLFEDSSTKFLGINPYESLEKVVSKIKLNADKGQKPDVIILTGDISQDFSANSYKLAAEVLHDFNCTILATMGNHDEADLFNNIICQDKCFKCSKKNIFGNWRVLILNSHFPAHVAGYLSESELDFLESELNSDKEIFTVIILHHHVLPIGSSWLDMLGLKNSEQFLEIIDKYKNIAAVFCGHVHQASMAFRKNVAFISTPAVSWQFARNSTTFMLDNLMPGYRMIELISSGEFKTEAIRLDFDKKFIPNFDQGTVAIK